MEVETEVSPAYQGQPRSRRSAGGGARQQRELARERLARGGADLDRDDLARRGDAVEVDDLVVRGAAAQPRRVVAGRALDQDVERAADEALGPPPGAGAGDLHQALHTPNGGVLGDESIGAGGAPPGPPRGGE